MGWGGSAVEGGAGAPASRSGGSSEDAVDPTSELISEALTSELISLQEDGGTAAEEAGNSPGPGLGGACVFPEPGSAQQQQQQSSATLSCTTTALRLSVQPYDCASVHSFLSAANASCTFRMASHRLARVQDFEQTSAAQDENSSSGGQRECGDVTGEARLAG